jgi:NADPH:quinone reductase-like Zn-dependent oxidoreductase
MKAIRVYAFGDNDQLKYEDAPDPVAGEGEVLVRVRAIGVNPVDHKIVRGYLGGFIPTTMPFIPGWDVAGEVVGRGHGARRFEVGDRVWAYARRPTIEHGTYAELIALPEAYVAAMPTSASFEQAAGVPLAGLTSWQALLDIAGLSSGERVLVLGASGGTGPFALQIAKLHGAAAYGVASAKNAALITELGATAIAYDAPDFAERLAQLQVDVIYDCIGGDSLLQARAALKPGGRVVSITTPQPPESYADTTYRYHFVEPNAAQLAELARAFDDGILSVLIDEVIPLAEAARAHERSAALHTRGKIILKP